MIASVLIPTIGRTTFLEETIRSVRTQELSDFEVLVLDNASPPEARELLETWAASDSRVTIHRVEKRIPMFENFNRGILAARGKYVTFFHDDDEYSPSFLRASTTAMERNPSAAIFASNCDFIDATGATTECRRWIRDDTLMPGHDYIEAILRRGRNIISMQGIVFRRAAIECGFDASLPIHFGDFVLLMRIAEQGDVLLCVEPLVRVRRHAGQASESVPLSQGIPLRTDVLLKFCDEYVTRHPNEHAFIQRMRRRIELTRRVGLLWGWMTAENKEEARGCARALDVNPMIEQMASVIRHPIHEMLRRQRLRNVVRRIASQLGV